MPVYNENDGNYCLGLWDGLDSVHVGKYGIKEPKLAKSDSTLIDKSLLWLVPGIAFDEHGRRLGRGGGFYDRLLNKYSGIPVGICAEEQLVSGVPFEEHDKKMKFIITPERVINC